MSEVGYEKYGDLGVGIEVGSQVRVWADGYFSEAYMGVGKVEKVVIHLNGAGGGIVALVLLDVRFTQERWIEGLDAFFVVDAKVPFARASLSGCIFMGVKN